MACAVTLVPVPVCVCDGEGAGVPVGGWQTWGGSALDAGGAMVSDGMRKVRARG